MNKCTSLLIVMMAGCGLSDENDALSGASTHAAPAPPVETNLDPKGGAELIGRLIGITNMPDRSCPDISGGTGSWRPEHLFAQRHEDVHDLPPGLQRFCLYTWTQGPLTKDDLEFELKQAKNYLPDISSDRPVVAPMAPVTLADTMAQSHLEVTAGRAGKAIKWGKAATRATRLVLLDTHPTYKPADLPWEQDGPNHGYSLSALAHDLSCDDVGTCLYDVGTRNAMPLRWEGPGDLSWNWNDGGDFGTIGALAEMIRAETAHWEDNGRDYELLLNLSLAWHAEYGGLEHPSEWPVDVRAVHAALLDAQCRGVTTFAAVGNQAGGPGDDDGAMLPAAWGDQIVSSSDCFAAVAQEDIEDDRFKEALLYPVGGTDHEGRDLVTSRQDSRPALLGFSENARVLNAHGATPPLAGTSVGTVVVSSAVAAVMASTNLSPDNAVRAVHKAGIYRNATSTWWESALHTQAREARVCAAVDLMCRVADAGCAPAEAPVCVPEGGDIKTDPDLIGSWDDNAQGDELTSFGPYAEPFVCGDNILFSNTPGVPDQPCIQSEVYDYIAQPFSGPQPGVGGCLLCVFDQAKSTLRLQSEIPFAAHHGAGIRLHYANGDTIDHRLRHLPESKVLYRKLDPHIFANVTAASYSSVVDGVRTTSPITIER